MLKVAIFISGRIMNYKKCLRPLIDHLKNQNKYDIKLFLSINSEKIYQDVLSTFSDVLGLYEFKPFFYEKDWIDNRLKNDRKYMGSYNQLSCFYNDLNNFHLIEKYENEKNMNFDVICKLRSDIVFKNIRQISFWKDNENEIILNNIILACTIKAFGISPPFLSDAICFGNKKSMKIYCDTYNTIKKNDIKYNGLYNLTFEPYLNEHIYDFPICGIPEFNKNRSQIPPYTKEEYLYKFINNSRNIKRKDFNWGYYIIRQNFDNTRDYRPGNKEIINNVEWLWKEKWTGLVHSDFINSECSNI